MKTVYISGMIGSQGKAYARMMKKLATQIPNDPQ